MRYIGSKSRVARAIADIVGPPVREGVFVDAMCGTGAVAVEAARRGWPVRLNDHLRAAVTVAHARLLSGADVSFSAFGGYPAAVTALARAERLEGFVWREYSPASRRFGRHERRYFTEDNAVAIDSARAQIARWRGLGTITVTEETLLIADVLAAASRIANTAGTYGCFLRAWSTGGRRPIELIARDLLPRQVRVEGHNVDVWNVPVAAGDVAYFDPPYTKRQYAAYYHVLETIAQGDEPVVTGVTGLRPWQDRASDFCYKTRALGAIAALVADTPARRILLSYSAEGHVSLAELARGLEEHGDVRLHAVGAVGRYRPNWQASLNGDAVREYVIEVTKEAAAKPIEPEEEQALAA